MPTRGLRALRFHISRRRYEVAIADLIVTVGSAYRLDASTDLAGLTTGLAADTDVDTLATKPRSRLSAKRSVTNGTLCSDRDAA